MGQLGPRMKKRCVNSKITCADRIQTSMSKVREYIAYYFLFLLFSRIVRRLIRTWKNSPFFVSPSHCNTTPEVAVILTTPPHVLAEWFPDNHLFLICRNQLSYPNPTQQSPVTADPYWNPVYNGFWFNTKMTHQLFQLFHSGISLCSNFRFPQFLSH